METLEARVYAGFPAFGIIYGFICIFHKLGGQICFEE